MVYRRPSCDVRVLTMSNKGPPAGLCNKINYVISVVWLFTLPDLRAIPTRRFTTTPIVFLIGRLLV